MKIIPITELIISANRQRKEFDDEAIGKLAGDITERGLLHAPVVRSTSEGPFVLVAGERRLRAITLLAEFATPYKYDGKTIGPGMVPVVSLGELSELEAEEAELSENINRKDLTWQERAEAHARLARLRTNQAAASGDKPPTTSSIAVEARTQANTLSQELVVAQALHIPEVAAARSLDEAVKTLTKIRATEHKKQLAATLGASVKANNHQLLRGDFRIQLATSTAQFDLVLSDPPYGVDADNFGDYGSKQREYRDASGADWTDLMVSFAETAFRLTKPKAHAYVFCDYRRFSELSGIFTLSGWSVWPRPLIWSKLNGVAPRPDHGPRNSYETILYAIKGDKPHQFIGLDVLPFTSTGSSGHPDEKPVALLVELIKRSCFPGDSVLDPFVGSGSIFPAATLAKVYATGVEQNDVYFSTAQSRMAGTK